MRPLTDVMRSTSGGVAANIRALTPSYLDPLWSTLLRLEFWSPLLSSEFSLSSLLVVLVLAGSHFHHRYTVKLEPDSSSVVRYHTTVHRVISGCLIKYLSLLTVWEHLT